MSSTTAFSISNDCKKTIQTVSVNHSGGGGLCLQWHWDTSVYWYSDRVIDWTARRGTDVSKRTVECSAKAEAVM